MLPVRLTSLLIILLFSLQHLCAVNTDSLSLKISGQWFLGYQYSDDTDPETNQFTLKRGYITFQTKLNHYLSVRFTQDITLDEEGEDAGNIEVRLKYCFLKLKLDDIAFITKPTFEFGLVHRPWLDFEQKINLYRVQGKMFLERYKIINSADFGITFMCNLGGEMPASYKKNVNKSYAGYYGSIMLGIYNGPGYHTFEINQNKTFEGRISVRPFPEFIPGLQFTYSNVIGKANNEASSNFFVNDFYISSESKYHKSAVQYYWGTGDYHDTYVDSLNIPGHNIGYSFFGEAKFLNNKLCLFERYDRFFSSSDNYDNIEKQSYVLGISSYFYKQNKILFDIDFSQDEPGGAYYKLFEIALEVLF